MAKSAASRQSFDNCRAQFEEILSSAKAAKYAPVYLLHGTEGYFIDRIESYISQHAIATEQKAFNETVVYGADTTGGEVALACKRYPMMSDRQLVVVREAQSLKKIEELEHYLTNPTPSTILVIAYRGKSMDKRSSLYKKFAKITSAVVFESTPPRDYELGRFITTLIAQKGLKAEPAAIEMIGSNIGVDLCRIDSEIEKLTTRLGAAASTTLITPSVVEDNIGISKTFNSFELNKALSYRKFDRAMVIAKHLGANPKESPLVVIIRSLFTHYQRIAKVAFMQYEAQRARTTLPNDNELCRAIKLTSSFFLEEYTSAARSYGVQRSVAILGMLREWDMKSKGMGTGGNSDGQLLEDLILRIATC